MTALANMDLRRVRTLKSWAEGNGPVVYWMDRDQRVFDNWALYFCIVVARQKKRDVEIIYNLDPEFLGGTLRQLDFKCKSLSVVRTQAHSLGIPLRIAVGPDAHREVADLAVRQDACMLVTDFSPLRIQRAWKQEASESIGMPFLEVDTHNVVPAWIVSQKLEFQAATIRPKIHKLLPSFLTEFPDRSEYVMDEPLPVDNSDLDEILANAKTDRTVLPVGWIDPGPEWADIALTGFLSGRAESYDALRNDPNADAQSGLSPYLHYGNISAQRMALEAQSADIPAESKEAFLEELIVRRELADNFCLYSPNYDRFASAWPWAQQTLEDHWADPREFVYSREQFERAETHDSLWNAAQLEMVKTGKMHGYMRMYWAKKILEWSANPEEALATAIYLNDRYELDGRDPNGYAGIMWSICGVHDRPWFDRPVYGKIRYMNRSGCEKKFDVGRYVGRWGKPPV